MSLLRGGVGYTSSPMMRRSLLLIAVVLAAACDRYVVKEQAGKTIRVDRFSGKTEVLRHGDDGIDRWVAVEEAGAPRPTLSPPRVEAALPVEELVLVNVEGGLLKDESAFARPRLALTVTNRSRWEVTAITVSVEYRAANGGTIFKLETLRPNPYSSLVEVGMQRGASETLESRLDSSATGGWRLVEARGYPPPQ